MKLPFITVFLLASRLLCTAQQPETLRFNPVKDDNKEFTDRLVRYPQFVKGKALLKNGAALPALFNYNYGTNEILFITDKNDTLALAAPEQCSSIVIAADTFCSFKNIYVQQLLNMPAYKLFRKRTLKLVAAEKKAAYGGYSSTSSSASLNIVSEDAGVHTLKTDENLVYQFKDFYYFADRFNKFYPATKKGACDLAWKNEKEVRSFIEENAIDFDKREDLEKLLAYMASLPSK